MSNIVNILCEITVLFWDFLPEEQTENGLIKKHKQIENYNKGKNVKKVNLF